jgi:hypothetical protein
MEILDIIMEGYNHHLPSRGGEKIASQMELTKGERWEKKRNRTKIMLSIT